MEGKSEKGPPPLQVDPKWYAVHLFLPKLLTTQRNSIQDALRAFFLSGIIHSSADFVLEKRIVSRSFKFFLIQAVAIMFEDFVIYIAKRLHYQGGAELKPWRVNESWVETAVRVIGYCWVTLGNSLVLLDVAGMAG